eukprot:2130959-Amphidinium_carterae.1
MNRAASENPHIWTLPRHSIRTLAWILWSLGVGNVAIGFPVVSAHLATRGGLCWCLIACDIKPAQRVV